MKQALGDRMKGNYEKAFNYYLPYRMPVIVRLDGRNFHTFTRRMERPFDSRFMSGMRGLAEFLFDEISTTVFAYSQSDEISLLLHPYRKLDSQPFFVNEIQKIASVTAGLASAYFTRAFDQIVVFDSRCFILPEDEVCNYFIWRSQDAARNSINMLAQSKFSHKELQGKNIKQMQEMMFQKDGTNWNDLDTDKKRGFAVYRDKVATDKEGEYSLICSDMNIPIFSQDREFIEKWLKVEED